MVDRVHSDSISFGRFELDESVCWERRSSFSENRNRYVEEAEKYARPGSVAEKKAYLEAHFRRKALLSQIQPHTHEDQSQHNNALTFMDKCISQCAEEAVKPLQPCAPKARVEEKSKGSGLKSSSQISSASLAQTCTRLLSVTTKNQKHIPHLKGSSLQSSLTTSKKQNHQSSKGNTVQDIKCEKERRPKKEVTLDPSTPARMESRRHPSSARMKHIAPPNSKETKRLVMNSSFRSERGEKTKEMKLCVSVMSCSFRSETRERITQEKTSQSATKLSFKAKPMPSFYHETAPKLSNKPRIVPKRGESTKSLSASEGSMLICSRRRKNDAMGSCKSQDSRVSLEKRNASTNFEPNRPKQVRQG